LIEFDIAVCDVLLKKYMEIIFLLDFSFIFNINISKQKKIIKKYINLIILVKKHF